MLVGLALSTPASARLVLRGLVLHGASKTGEEPILARMRLHRGDPLDFAVLQAAEEHLVASDLFTSVKVWLDLPREEATRKMYLEDEPTPVDLQVTVQEKFSWFVVPIASAGAGDRAIGLAYGDQNLAGHGVQLVAAGQYGESKSYGWAGFRDPIVGFAPLSYSFAGVYRLEDFRFFAGQRLVLDVPTTVAGGEGQIGWVVTPTVRALVGGLFNHVQLAGAHDADPIVKDPAYNRREGNIVVAQLYLLYDATTAPEGLQRGTKISLKNEVSDRFWGSDFDYAKLDFQLELHGLLWHTYPSLVFRTVLNYPTSERGVPLTQLLRAGGEDLRGFLVNEFHGDTLVSMQLEDQVPIFKDLQVPLVPLKVSVAGAVFLDTGALLDRHPGGIAGATAERPQPDFSDFHSGVGAGLRLLIPGVAIPALKVDVGYGIDVKDWAVTVSIAGSGK